MVLLKTGDNMEEKKIFGCLLEDYTKDKEYERLVQLSSAVVQILPSHHPEKIKFGTGFFISRSPPLILTAFHVIPDQKTSIFTRFKLNFDRENSSENIEIIEGSNLVYTNQKLDFSIVQLCHTPNSDYSIINLEKNDLSWFNPQLYIIHHPFNQVKLINANRIKLAHFNEIRGLLGCIKDRKVIHDLFLLEKETKIAYWESLNEKLTKCTERGSSGAPVFDSNWKLIGMHQVGLYEGPNTPTPISIGVHINQIKEDYENSLSHFSTLKES